jgi:hypothetical protein
MRVVRHNKTRDRTINLTRQITPQAGDRHEFLIAVAGDPAAEMWPVADDAPVSFNQTRVVVPLQRYSHRRMREEVVTTKQWGDHTVEFVDEWWDTYTWLGVDHEGVKIT